MTRSTPGPLAPPETAPLDVVRVGAVDEEMVRRLPGRRPASTAPSQRGTRGRAARRPSTVKAMATGRPTSRALPDNPDGLPLIPDSAQRPRHDVGAALRQAPGPASGDRQPPRQRRSAGPRSPAGLPVAPRRHRPAPRESEPLVLLSEAVSWCHCSPVGSVEIGGGCSRAFDPSRGSPARSAPRGGARHQLVGRSRRSRRSSRASSFRPSASSMSGNAAKCGSSTGRGGGSGRSRGPRRSPWAGRPAAGQGRADGLGLLGRHGASVRRSLQVRWVLPV